MNDDKTMTKALNRLADSNDRMADALEQVNMRLGAIARLQERYAATQQIQLEAIATYLNKLTGDEQ